MNRVFGILVSLILAGHCFAQWYGYYPTYDDVNELDAGAGLTWIDNQAYYTISFQPDISIGKLGIGLGIDLLYHSDTGKIRSQDWNSSYDFFRLIRYLRYGRKGESFYTRVGALDAARLGHGFLVNFYNNQLYYDERKLGMTLEADFGHFGFESLTNNMGRLEVLGGRGYVRPFYSSESFFFKNFAVGASYATDLDPDAYKDTPDDIAVWGADVEMGVMKNDILKIMVYTDYAKIVNYGSGRAIGFQTDFNTLWGFLKLGVNFERRWMGKSFIANYFGPFYEVLRYAMVGEVLEFYESVGGESSAVLAETLTRYFDDLGYDVSSIEGGDMAAIYPVIASWPVSKEMLLPMMRENRKGWYGALYLDFSHLIRLFGSYQRVDHQENSGMLHLGVELSRSIPFVALEATYDKRGIRNFEDVRTLDYRSVARLGVGYKIRSYLLFYVDYIWSFEWDEDRKQYKPQERFQPRLAYRYNFSGF